jgi:ubiquinone/menaquinone biosynthesis C-methylase UbiE
VETFPEGKEFLKILMNTGFNQCSMKRLTWGVATIYSGYKAGSPS